MKRYLFLILLLCCSMFYSNAQTIINLWDSIPPTDNGLTEPEITENGFVSRISNPEIIVYLPDSIKNKKKVVIICPGGAYAGLAIDHEGRQFAEWLNAEGITAVILKYRMPNGHKEVPLDDFHQAMRYVKSKSVEWNIVDENMQTKIGIAGFSAGGHLASAASTHYASSELRPDFTILFYPVITMGNYTHEGSRDNLLGENPSANDVMYYSSEDHINRQTPPAILLLSDDDTLVIPKNSIMYYDALKKNEIPSTMYVFPEGGHGWGMRSDFKYHQEMLILLKHWLDKI